MARSVPTPHGFAALSPDRRREIASHGGTTAHQQGKAHRWTVEEARAAGRKGGLARRKHEPPLTEKPYEG